MSGDTNARNHRRLVDRDFHLHSLSSAIECGSGTGHHGGGRWRSEHGSAAGKTEGRSRGGGPENPGWFWPMTVSGPMTRADQSAIGLAVAVMLLITVWGWL